jgi:hypothetical protein
VVEIPDASGNYSLPLFDCQNKSNIKFTSNSKREADWGIVPLASLSSTIVYKESVKIERSIMQITS